MSIRYQMTLLLVALSTFFVGTTWAMQHYVMLPAFASIERESAVHSLGRCIEAIDAETRTISMLAGDYAAWDDTCVFVTDGNEAYRESNLTRSFHQTTGNDFLAIVNGQSEVLATSCIAPESGQPRAVPEVLAMIQAAGSPFTDFSDKDQSLEGMVHTSFGPLLVAAHPILTSKREGPVRGSVIMGRFLNPKVTADLSEQIHAASNLAILDFNNSGISDQIRTSLPVSGVAAKTVEIDKATLRASIVHNDVFEKPLIIVTLLIPRTISLQGRATANLATICGLIGVVSMLFGTGLALRYRVVAPLQKMAAHVAKVGETDNLDARLQSTRGDEIGILARSFDGMVEKLAESREKIQAAAHRAGMAEIASEVLHNVGNAVNTANCCVELVEDRLTASRLSGLEMATLMLAEQAPQAAHFFSQDPRGPKLVHYLVSLNNTLQRERCENLEELRRLQDTIRHIRDAIASQQGHARRSDFRQRVELISLLEESLLLNAALQQQTGAQVKIIAGDLPEFHLNRSRLAQVLVNLEKNAFLAMQSVADREHVLEIAIDIFADDSLQISLRDSGVGFTSEVQNRLFAQGYTTRVEGSGQGLHYCSNVIREMGGEIWAESDGPGLGAVFIISIPRAVRRSQQLSASSEPRSDASSATESVNTSSYEKAEQYV